MVEPELKVTEAYRNARRLAMSVAALGGAWATAQFETASLDFPILGKLNLGSTSIPVILGFTSVYLCIRFVIEFGMMPADVKRNAYAQFEFRLCTICLRLCLASIAAAVFNRSIFGAAKVITPLLIYSGAAIVGSRVMVRRIQAMERDVRAATHLTDPNATLEDLYPNTVMNTPTHAQVLRMIPMRVQLVSLVLIPFLIEIAFALILRHPVRADEVFTSVVAGILATSFWFEVAYLPKLFLVDEKPLFSRRAA